MKINLTDDRQTNTYVAIMTPTRQPLGRRNPAEVNHTLLRVVGKTPALDVAAFQSFAD